VLRVRKLLTKRRIRLSGPREIQAVLHGDNVLSQVPSTATIGRILHASGLAHTTAPARTAYFPQPTTRENYVLHLMDWTLRSLKGGIKVYAFHSLDLQTLALQQTVSTNKSGQTVYQHVLQTWQKIGLPHGLQMGHDAAFCGGYRVKRVFSPLVRLLASGGFSCPVRLLLRLQSTTRSRFDISPFRAGWPCHATCKLTVATPAVSAGYVRSGGSEIGCRSQP
jgi:hypothetical protein